MLFKITYHDTQIVFAIVHVEMVHPEPAHLFMQLIAGVNLS